MMSVLLVMNACVTVALIVLILLQKTDPSSGGMFGGAGGSQTVVRNPLAKPTAWLAALFMVLTLAVAFLNKGGEHHSGSVMANLEHATPAQPAAPVAPAPAAMQPAMVGPEALPAAPAQAPAMPSGTGVEPATVSPSL